MRCDQSRSSFQEKKSWSQPGGTAAMISSGADEVDGDDDDADGGGDFEDELDEVVHYDGVHAADDAIDAGDDEHGGAVIFVADIPGEEGFGEFPDAAEGVAEEADDVDHGVDDDADVGEFGALGVAEAGAHPFGAGEHVGAADPGAEVDHAEDDAEERPDPEEPGGFDAVDVEHHDEPHGAGDVNAGGAMGDADDPPGEAFAGEEVGLGALGGLGGRPPANQGGGAG